MGGILTLSILTEILAVYLVGTLDRLYQSVYLSVTVTGDKFRIFGPVYVAIEINCNVRKICHGG